MIRAAMVEPAQSSLRTFRILRERWFGLKLDASDRGVLARGVPLPALAGSASSAAASAASAAAASSVDGESVPAAASSYICGGARRHSSAKSHDICPLIAKHNFRRQLLPSY